MKNLIPWRKRGSDMSLSRESDNPFDLLHRQMNELFDNFFKEFEESRLPGLGRHDRNVAAVSPSFEVAETEQDIRVTAELPGLDEKDIEVTLDENRLTVKGEKKQEREEKNKNYYLAERRYGQFQRMVPLPAGIDKENAKAQFKKGILSVILPKTEQAKTQRKRINITSE